MYLHSLLGISTLFVACSIAGAQTQQYTTTDLGLAALNNGTQDGTLTIDRETNRVPQYRWGVFDVPPADVPATDSKGAIVKRVDSKGAMAPSVCNERWEVFASTYWLTQKVDEQWPSRPVPQSDIEMWGVNAGARYRLNDAWTLGGMVGYNDTFIDLSAFPFFGGAKLAKVQVDTWAFTPFVTFEKKSLIAGADFLAQLQYTYDSSNYDNNIVIANVRGSRSGYANTVDLTTGLTWTSGDLHHGPVLGARYTSAHLDSFNLNPGSIPVGSSNFDSLASVLGYQVSYDIKVGGGKIVPFASASWEHEFKGGYDNVVAGLPNGTIDKDTTVLGAGVGWYGNCGWNVVADYEGRLNDASRSNFVGLKVGKTF
jgi:hypothetical protein